MTCHLVCQHFAPCPTNRAALRYIWPLTLLLFPIKVVCDATMYVWNFYCIHITIPATCCCSSGTTPLSSCAPPSPYWSPPLWGSFGCRARWQDVRVHPVARRPPTPTCRPAWSGCLPAGGITRGAVTTMIRLLCPPHTGHITVHTIRAVAKDE